MILLRWVLNARLIIFFSHSLEFRRENVSNINGKNDDDARWRK